MVRSAFFRRGPRGLTPPRRRPRAGPPAPAPPSTAAPAAPTAAPCAAVQDDDPERDGELVAGAVGDRERGGVRARRDILVGDGGAFVARAVAEPPPEEDAARVRRARVELDA